MSAGAAGEEITQCGKVGLVGVGLDPVEAFFAHLGFEMIVAPVGKGRVALTRVFTTGIDFDHFASFGVFEGDQADLWELAFARVAERNADQVVALIGERECFEDASGLRFVEKVGNQEHDGLAALHTIEIIERGLV